MKTYMVFDGVDREIEIEVFDKAWPQMAVSGFFIDDEKPLSEDQIEKLNDRTAMKGWD